MINNNCASFIYNLYFILKSGADKLSDYLFETREYISVQDLK